MQENGVILSLKGVLYAEINTNVSSITCDTPEFTFQTPLQVEFICGRSEEMQDVINMNDENRDLVSIYSNKTFLI